jgi:hypothetical protein
MIKIILHLISNENLSREEAILICFGLFISYSIFFWIKISCFDTPIKHLTNEDMEAIEALMNEDMEHFIDEDIEAIMNENIVSVSNANIEDFITDSDSSTELETDYQSTFDSESSSDTESILNDPNLYFMPNVDFDVCPIEELKFFEFSSLYAREIAEHYITDEDIREFISWWSKEELATNWINEFFVMTISLI